MKAQTPTKRTAHRLAAALAIATTFAATGAWAATDCKWTGGGTDTKWSTPANWHNSTVPTSSEHNARFVSSDVTVNNYVALLDGAHACNVLHVSGSSAANPWTFEAADSSSGLTIVDDGWLGCVAAGWLWLKSGTYTFEKSLRAGINANTSGTYESDKYPLWLKVGDGESDVTLNVKGTYGPIFGSSSEFVADKATLDFTGKDFAMYSSSSASITNSTMTVGAVKLNGTSLMTLSDTTMTVRNDLNIADAAGANCTLSGTSSTINLTGSHFVFNVGYGANSTGTVIKDGGDWSCYYLRIGTGSGSTGSFVQKGGTMAASKEFSIGQGENSTGSFTLNGGTLALSNFSPNIGNGKNSRAEFNIANGSVTHTGNYFLTVGRTTGSTATMTVGPGGKYTSTGNNVWGLLVGWDAPGTLNIAGGEVETRILSLCNTINAANSEVNITDGGVLAIDYVKYTDNTRDTKVNFDGGKMKRRTQSGVSKTFFDANANVTVSVGAKGAEFDANGYDIAINEALEDKSGEAGKVRFSGGGSITLGGANTYSGGTTIELGTKVVAANATVKDHILSSLVVDGSTKLADENGIVLFEYSGLTDEDVPTTPVYKNCGTGTTIYRDGDTIKVNFVAPTWELDANHLTWSSLVAKYGVPAADATVTIKSDANYTLTVDQDATVGELVFKGSGSVTLAVNSGCTLAKTGSGTALWSLDNASAGTISVNAGTLKVKSVTGTGTAQTIVVKSGATFDMNGIAVTTASVRLEEGATLKNDGAKNIRNDTHQTTNLILDGDATVNAVKFFGLCGSSASAATTLNIGEHTLTVEGIGFWLVNTTIDGSGEIVANGVLSVPMGSSSGADCTLTIAAGGKLHGTGALSVKNFTNNGSIDATYNPTLTVTGTLTPANAIPKLTLASGATVKATGTAQTVSTTFSASGTITVDASEITKAQLDAGDVPVLTVPATFNHSGVTWNVTGAAIEGARAKWRTDEGGATKTLYVGKSIGLTITFY